MISKEDFVNNTLSSSEGREFIKYLMRAHGYSEERASYEVKKSYEELYDRVNDLSTSTPLTEQEKPKQKRFYLPREKWDRREKILTRAALRISKALSDFRFGYEEFDMMHGNSIESLDFQEFQKLFEQYIGGHIERYVDAVFDAVKELSFLEKDDE